MNLLRDNRLKKVAKQVEFCRVKQRSSGLFRICNPIISLRHFYSIFVWICIEICGLIIWLVVRKNTQYQALSAFYGEIRSYEIGTFALDTKFHVLIFLKSNINPIIILYFTAKCKGFAENKANYFQQSPFMYLFVLTFENLVSEQDDIKHRKERHEDDQRQNRLYRCQGCQEHHREAEDDSREVLVNHIIGRGGLELTVDLTQQDRTRARRARQHTVHHQELLLAVIGEEFFGNDAVINVGNDETNHAQNENYAPEAFQRIQTDRRNACHNHQVEEEVADTGHEEVVSVLFTNNTLAAQEVEQNLDQRCRKNAQEEVEAVNHGSHTRQKRAQPQHKEIRHDVRNHDQRDLHGHFVKAFLHRNFEHGFHLLCLRASVGTVGDYQLAAPFCNVEVDNTADCRRQKSERRNREAKALTAHESVIDLVDRAVVKSLSRTLAVAEGKQNACRREEILDKESSNDQTDTKAEDALYQIGCNRGNARVEDLHAALLGELTSVGLKGRGDKSECQRVIGNHLKAIGAMAVEHGGIKHHVARDPLVNGCHDQEERTAQHRRGNQRLLEPRNCFLEHIARQKAAQQNTEEQYPAPYVKVPKI